jgi:alkyl sulfatase BDS1-like metallo-beta-lactamase superfamily hydrolase
MSDDQGRNPATDHTIAAQREFSDGLPADDPIDHERVTRGFIAHRADPVIPNTSAAAEWAPNSWNLSNWEFIQGDAPPTVNPSLWRQAKLNGEHGLYEVIEGFYQVRSFDTSVVTFIRGGTGWVVIDPLTTEETARAAFDLVREHLGDLPVNAVIHTHSHLDHYGGVLGVVSRERVEAGLCAIVAPEGFLEAAVSENVAAGAAMGRRALYQYGMLLPWDDRGHVDQGLSKGPPIGSSALVAPTIEITETGQELTLDGIRIEFQLTPDTEAPAEMHFYFPDHKVLCLAENCTGTMHNVGTLRGAVVRDALHWSRYIDDAIEAYGDRLEVSIACHSWPRWGRDDVLEHMATQRDLYRWIHDEAMRLANKGYTPDEIAAEVELPDGLWADWSCHGYYGTVSHNVRAVYQRYLGWYDGHPSSLSPYQPTEAAVRYVEFMGGMETLLANARRSYAEGDYRWVAQVLRHAVFADSGNAEARALQADAFEQLGYQAEAGPWRDIYLMGAQELRQGPMGLDFPFAPDLEAAAGMNLEQVFDYLAIKLDGPTAAALGHIVFNWKLSDTGEHIRVRLSNGTLQGVVGHVADDPAATVTSTRGALDTMIATGATMEALAGSGDLTIDGDAGAIVVIWEHMESFPLFFNIVEP